MNQTITLKLNLQTLLLTLRLTSASILFLIGFYSYTIAIDRVSTGTGDWNDASTWSPSGIPTAADNVTILTGHVVSMPSGGGGVATECNNLIVQASGSVQLGTKDHTTNGTTTLSGIINDTNNSGVVTFVGKVTINSGGTFNTSIINVSANLLFENGIENNSSNFIGEDATFLTNNQSLSGTEPIIFEGSVLIGSGVNLTNTLASGFTFSGLGATIDGVDGTSQLTNEALLLMQNKNTSMTTGIVDLTTTPNTVEYSSDGFNQDVNGWTYHNLLIGTNPGKDNYDREAQADIIVNNTLVVENGAQFEIDGFNLTVSGNATVFGIFNDDVAAGTNSFTNLEVGNDAIFNGANANYGVYTVSGNVTVSADTAKFNQGTFTVTGTTTVSPGATLLVGHQSGAKTFGIVNIGVGSEFGLDVSNNGTVVTFNGAVSNSGTLGFDRGTYTFNANVTNAATGTFAVTGNGDIEFKADFTNEGANNFDTGSYLFNNSTIGGTAAVAFDGKVTIADASTLVNDNSGGITYTNRLDGATFSSTYENLETTIYNPNSRDEPMTTGILDTDAIGNTFAYSRFSIAQDVSGGTYYNLTFDNGPGDRELADSDVTVTGNLVNSETQTGTFQITISGTEVQTISGGGTFLDLTVNKSGGTLTATESFNITQSLVMINGILATGANTIDLGTASTISETSASYVTGLVQAERTIGGGGTSTFDGLGLTLTGGGVAMGATTVLRQTGVASLTGGILRDFTITPTVNAGLNATIVFNYTDNELNALTESNFVLIHDNGGGFLNIGGTLDAGANTVTFAGINVFGNITVGDPTSFPVEWLDFVAYPERGNVILEWSTAVEINNDYYSVERSADGILFSSIGKVEGAGTTNEVQNYSYVDPEGMNFNTSKLFYRIRQIDINGQFDFSNIVEVFVENEDIISIDAFPSPFQNELNINIFLSEASPVNIKMLDMAGKMVWQTRIEGETGNNTFTYSGEKLSKGMYFLEVTSQTEKDFIRVMKK